MSSQYYAGIVLYSSLICSFIALRHVELVDSMDSPMCWLLMGIGAVAMVSLFVKPSATMSYMVRRLVLITMICIQLKNSMDKDLKHGIQYRNLLGYTAIITDNHQPYTFSIAKLLVAMNCEVVLACHVEAASSCMQTVQHIQDLFPNKTELISSQELDLTNLHSIKQFVDAFLTQHSRLDYLINSADLHTDKPQHGLDMHFSMKYFGHFALTEWLLPTMLQPILTSAYHNQTAAKVLNVASASLLAGSFHPSLLTDNSLAGLLASDSNQSCTWLQRLSGHHCTAAMDRAHLASLLHSHELQQHIDHYILQQTQTATRKPEAVNYRRCITAALHPGTVLHSSNSRLHEQMLYSLFGRSADDAALVFLHAILDDEYTPGTYINALKTNLDMLQVRKQHLPMHLALFADMDLLYLRPSTFPGFGYVLLRWPALKAIWPMPAEQVGVETVASRLYDVSHQVLEDWSKLEDSADPASSSHDMVDDVLV